MSTTTMNKELWTAMFEAIGLDHDTMYRWHAEFERSSPDGHQSFLEWLGVDGGEIDRIRESSRTTWAQL